MTRLDWPEESAHTGEDDAARWQHERSNLCLDFHGDPAVADCVVFSDGNHHMALAEALRAFSETHGAHVFYATTPPAGVLAWQRRGALRVGNLRLSLRPHVFISPPAVLDQVVADRRMAAHHPLARSRGNVLLVRKGNPKGIRRIADLTRSDVRLFLPNREHEGVSRSVYVETLQALAGAEGVTLAGLAGGLAPMIIEGELVHHREAPQSLADDRVDVAMLYYHLALRYTRVFADTFELLSLDGAPEDPHPGNRISRTHIGLIDDGGAWGERLLAFMSSDRVHGIYETHGLTTEA